MASIQARFMKKTGLPRDRMGEIVEVDSGKSFYEYVISYIDVKSNSLVKQSL